MRRNIFILAAAALGASHGALAQTVASYAPSYVDCPSESLIRFAGTPQNGNQTLNPGEVAYTSSRLDLVRENLKTWLESDDEGSKVYYGDLDALSDAEVPNIALALSGGAYRAALFNAAALHLFDARNDTSVKNGLGGLLQSSLYMSALSGGSYVTNSLLFNDFPMILDMVFGSNASGLPGWQLEEQLFAPGVNGSLEDQYIGDLMYDLSDKRAAGDFPVTFCDMWGRALAYHFLPNTTANSFGTNSTGGNHAAALTYSSMTQTANWKNHTFPYPIIVQDSYSPNNNATPFGSSASVPLSGVAYEVTPHEWGSYDPQLAAFVSLPYLGSIIEGGKPQKCAANFDNAGLMMGTSACAFHTYNYTNDPLWTNPEGFYPLVQLINSTFYQYQPGQEMDTTAIPNPFYGLSETYQDNDETNLSLFDGSLDGENDPLLPLLVPKREVDVIILMDSSGETEELKPSGFSLLATQAKTRLLPEGTANFPQPFPNSTEEFDAKGLNVRPVFFGCGRPKSPADNFPLLVFIPNSDPGGVTNISLATLQLPLANTTELFERSYLLANRGYPGASQVNNTDLSVADSEWPTCVKCAVVERVRAHGGYKRTPACEQCLSKYCYTGQSMI